ncbi:MAG TPA: DUF262 domain-containing HNH endonuclease family protein [Acidobacteriaceae bacterium]|nr:DUF262 domain-containing HNH endonuclease family protein [Acidobacteriaceae bacterium]
MKIRSIDKSINDVLKSPFYKIPRFQRPYSWEPENVEDFWSDVFENSGPDYFIGSMVAFQPPNSDTASVVDGQQRLTTIVMLLAAIRNAFASEGHKDSASGIQALIERPDIDNQNRYTLQPETSYPYFQEHIQSSKPPEVDPELGVEEEALKLTFEYFTDQIEQAVEAAKKDPSIVGKTESIKARKRLSELRDKLLSLKVIYIDLDNEDDAYLIFETMNTRGKELEPSDLVKSHLTKLIRPANRGVDVTKNHWNKMVEVIEGSQADLTVSTYLHHFWLSRYEYVTVKELYKAIKRNIDKEHAKEFLKSVVEDSSIYRQIQETSYRKWKKGERRVKDAVEALIIFRVKQPLPMVLALMHAYDADLLKLSQVQEAMMAIEKFHFIFTAVTSQRSSGGISFMYALHARELLRAKDANGRGKVLNELKKKLKAKIPPYEEFESNFLNFAFTDTFTKQKKTIQYILACLDRGEKNGVAVDYEQMTIEHIAPQSGRLNEAAVGSIGNLLLCESSFNGEQLAAKTFQEKKKILKKSKVTLDSTIRNATKWSSTEIDERARAMAKRAYTKVWKM